MPGRGKFSFAKKLHEEIGDDIFLKNVISANKQKRP